MTFRVKLAAAAVLGAALLPQVPRAIEGTPPFLWFAPGSPVAEYQWVFESASEFGLASSFSGGDPEEFMTFDRYVAAPLMFRYGMWNDLEAYCVVPFFWGASSQRYLNTAVFGPPQLYSGKVSGADLGDFAAGLKWRFWGDDFTDAVVLHAGMGFPLGTNVWQNIEYNFLTSSDTPRFSAGDGAIKIFAALSGLWEEDYFRVSALLGYVWKLPVAATAIEPPGSTIDVNLPSPVVGIFKPSFEIGEGFRLDLITEGYFAPRGSVSPGGLLAKEPGSTQVLLDSYMNMVSSEAGVWQGAGVAWELGGGNRVEVNLKAPVFALGIYRFWRAGLTVYFTGKN